MIAVSDLLALATRDRLRAIRRLPASCELAFALRRVLFTDHHADVRAAAALRLGELPFPDVDAWLVDALVDHAPVVRDAILRALAKVGGPVRDAVRAVVATDRVWWVRRAALYALGALGGAGELAALEAALDDPFWRVRHAAVKVLAVLGARDLEVREAIALRASPARAYLRAAWGPVAIEPPGAAASGATALPPELLDRDPAVVTARLAASDARPLALVELLCDPHAPLRMLAAERLVASGDIDALRAALDWLEHARVPHVADTVETMLDRLGDRAADIAAFALAPDRIARPGAARWAIRWVAATGDRDLAELAVARARADASLRGLAVRLASTDELARWASEPGAIAAIAAELHARRTPDAHAALLAIDAPTMRDVPAARALQIDAAARAEAWHVVERGLADPHHAPRAIATQALVRARRIDPESSRADRDPAVREAGLVPHTATLAVADPDPFVARAAIAHLAAAYRIAHELPPDVAAAAMRAVASADPAIRATALDLPLVSPAALCRAIELLADADEQVRSAALDALERADNLDARLAALESTASPIARRMIAAWLRGEAAIAAPDVVVATQPRAPRVVDQRAFGRAGFTVAPLAISGAFELVERDLARAEHAGVNLWFWEPAYTQLTRFLRGRAGHVIAGSYHADAASIEADVDRACRELRRDALDALLLFWSRSPARVDASAFAAVRHLVTTGKVRALGFSTHDRALAAHAIATSPWDVVMIRHSAAHPGIERELLPIAREHGTAIVTFSALCYGRMVTGPNAPTAADCYRYSLAQPGVTACISAPRRSRELAENLGVLAAPPLDADAIAALRLHGEGVRAENQRFNTLMRQPTRDAAAAARELLAAELPPDDELIERPLPRSSDRRVARTRLHRAKRRS